MQDCELASLRCWSCCRAYHPPHRVSIAGPWLHHPLYAPVVETGQTVSCVICTARTRAAASSLTHPAHRALQAEDPAHKPGDIHPDARPNAAGALWQPARSPAPHPQVTPTCLGHYGISGCFPKLVAAPCQRLGRLLRTTTCSKPSKHFVGCELS